jgi:cobalamin biosynthesis Mg chelatase CobN
MQGTSIRRIWNSSRFWPAAVLALLALACFPMFARADAAGSQYEEPEKLPTATGKTASRSMAQAANSAPSQTGGKSARKAFSKGGPSSADGNGPGSPHNGSLNSVQQTRSTHATNSDSSPLIPISAAIVALAVISISVVMVRRWRKGPRTASAESSKASY